MNVIRSRQHNLSPEQVNKIAVSANDDKRIIRPDKIQTFAHWYRTGWQCNRGSGKGSRLGHEGNWLRAGQDTRGTDLGQMGQAETWEELTGAKEKWGTMPKTSLLRIYLLLKSISFVFSKAMIFIVDKIILLSTNTGLSFCPKYAVTFNFLTSLQTHFYKFYFLHFPRSYYIPDSSNIRMTPAASYEYYKKI